MDFNNEDHRKELAKYFSSRVFSHTPIPNHPRPAHVDDQDPTNIRTDLAELLNPCQRHSKCLPTYCLRWNRQACRFGFPQSECDEQKIDRNHKGQWTFYPFRPQSDADLNPFHPIWTSMWRGNIDLSQCWESMQLSTISPGMHR